MFSERVSVSRVEFDVVWGTVIANEVKSLLASYFDNQPVTLYEIQRTEEGLSHPAYVLELSEQAARKAAFSGNNPFAVIRYYEKSTSSDGGGVFDRAKYHLERMEKLSRLSEFYPAHRLIERDGRNGVVVLNEFYFYPISRFNTEDSVLKLFALMREAAVKEIFLDFNQNHWLYSEAESRLLYCDADYIEDLPYERAVQENFNQSTLFLNESNVKFFATAIIFYLKSKKKVERDFGNAISEIIREKVALLQERENTVSVQKRLKSYITILEDIEVTTKNLSKINKGGRKMTDSVLL